MCIMVNRRNGCVLWLTGGMGVYYGSRVSLTMVLADLSLSRCSTDVVQM